MRDDMKFTPDWAICPGATVIDILEERGIAPTEFASSIGIKEPYFSAIIVGESPITDEIAEKFKNSLGSSKSFWLTLEENYREDLLRQQMGHMKDWVGKLPVKDMKRFGWLKEIEYSTENVADGCLKFFDVPNLNAWKDRYLPILSTAAYRTSASFDSQSESMAAWIRQGEIQGETTACLPWNRQAFSDALPRIRALTKRKEPKVFLPELKSICSQCGVAVEIVRAPSGCRASGATLFINPDKALILLSFRFLTDDHFWFTFFHEAGHLILHNENMVFIEGSNFISSKEEEEANKFASDFLVPEEYNNDLERIPRNGNDIIRLSIKIGISPGIIVGQMQHRGIISNKQLNSLKRRYKWGPE